MRTGDRATDVTVFTDNEFASLIGKRFAAINQALTAFAGEAAALSANARPWAAAC
jgi:hypothetical protein